MTNLDAAVPMTQEGASSQGCGAPMMERVLRGLAGTVVLSSALLAAFHDRHWLYLTAFAGVNLFQSAFTNWCPQMWVLRKFGVR